MTFDLHICSFRSQIITIDEAKRRQSFGSCDCDLSTEALPMLSDSSDLLQDTDIEKVPYTSQTTLHVVISALGSIVGYGLSPPPQLSCRLPARVQGYPWRLAYSTVKHGTSLKTLYRSLVDVDSPVLLVIKDTDNRVCLGCSHHQFNQTDVQIFL